MDAPAAYKLNAPRGFGDAIYLRAVVLHLLARGETVQVFTQWPHVFKGLPVKLSKLTEVEYGEEVHFAAACYQCRIPAIMALDQFSVICLQSGITEKVDLQLRWTVRNRALVEKIRQDAAGRPIMLYQPEKVSANPDEKLLRPRREAFEKFLLEHSDCYRIRLGHPRYAKDHRLPCELDLFGLTRVRDVFDLAVTCDTIFGEAASYLPIIAQAADKPFTCLFSTRGMAAVNRRHVWVIRPSLIFHKKHLATAIFDE